MPERGSAAGSCLVRRAARGRRGVRPRRTGIAIRLLERGAGREDREPRSRTFDPPRSIRVKPAFAQRGESARCSELVIGPVLEHDLECPMIERDALGRLGPNDPLALSRTKKLERSMMAERIVARAAE